jgi:hypothetical protein
MLETLERGGQSASIPALLDLVKQSPMKFPQYEARPEQLGLF